MEDGPRTFRFTNVTEDHAKRASFEPPRFAYLRILLALTLGIGKSFWSALTYDEIFWWYWHKQFIDEWIKSSWEPCPVLTKSDIHWDLVQILTFVGTAGTYVAERRGAITDDGYLLISHKLHLVPKNIQKHFYNPRAFTLSSLIVLYLIRMIIGRTRISAFTRDKSLQPATPLLQEKSHQPSYQQVHQELEKDLSLNLEGTVPKAATKDDGDLRVITQGECLLPIESTRATGSTTNIIFDNTPCPAARSQADVTSPTPNDEDSSVGEDRWPIRNELPRSLEGHVRFGDVRNPREFDELKDDSNNLNNLSISGNNLGHRVSPHHRVVVFQHGLLESSASYIFPLWSPGPNERIIHVPLRLVRCLLLPWLTIRRLILHILRQFTCLIPARRDRENLSSRFEHSLPINALSKDPGLEVWLTNSRGSEFSTNLLDPGARCMPTGSRTLMYREYRQIFNVYTREHWTYIDSAVLDCEALYSMLFKYYRTTQLRVTVVAFSQGCAVFALNAGMKAKIKRQQDLGGAEQPAVERRGERGGVLQGNSSIDEEDSPPSPPLSPPNFPLVISGNQNYTLATTTLDGISQNDLSQNEICQDDFGQDEINFSSPRTGSALLVATPAWAPLQQPPQLGQGQQNGGGPSPNSGWTSGIFSTPEEYGFDLIYQNHLGGDCVGLKGGCEFCNMIPSNLILIAPPIMLKHLTGPAKSFGECWKVVFCKTAWTHLHYLVAIITMVQSFLHVRLGLIGQIFVQYILCFGIRPMHRDVADLIYKLVPSGMTTRENMLLWNSQMDGSSVLGSDMKYLPGTVRYAQTIWKSDKLPTDVELESWLPCATTIYAGIQDNIADSIAAAGRFVSEGFASLRVLDTCENSGHISVSSKTKIAINLIAGTSHLDILWPASNNRLIQYIMNDVLKTPA